MTPRSRFESAAPAYVANLEGAKAIRFAASTMLIPSPAMMLAAIRQIPFGQTETLVALRARLAKENGADVTCPRAASIGWRLSAELAEEELVTDVPWWRVTLDGKPNPKLPGGAERHRELIASER